jgi:hypothetical protein
VTQTGETGETGATGQTGDGDQTGDQADDVQPDDQGRFPGDYVRELRAENARRRSEAREARERADRADERLRATQGRLADLTINTAAAGILAAPDDLLRYVEAGQLVDDDGNPDPAKVRAAAEQLVKDRPHLAPRKPAVAGDVDQGARPEGPPPIGETFAGMLKRAAG